MGWVGTFCTLISTALPLKEILQRIQPLLSTILNKENKCTHNFKNGYRYIGLCSYSCRIKILGLAIVCSIVIKPPFYYFTILLQSRFRTFMYHFTCAFIFILHSIFHKLYTSYSVYIHLPITALDTVLYTNSRCYKG